MSSPRRESRSASPPSTRQSESSSPRPRGGDDSREREERRESRESSETEIQNTGNNLYVSGLNVKTTEEELSHKFSKCGKVIESSLVRDRDGNPRGFGFVRMETIEQADAAIAELNGEDLNGYALRVEKAKRSCPRDPTPGRYLGNDRSGYRQHHHHHHRGDRYDNHRGYDHHHHHRTGGSGGYGGFGGGSGGYADRYGAPAGDYRGFGGDHRYPMGVHHDHRYGADHRYGGDHRYGVDHRYPVNDRYSAGDRYDHERYRGYGVANVYEHGHPRPEYTRSSRYQPYERRSSPYRRSRSRSR